VFLIELTIFGASMNCSMFRKPDWEALKNFRIALDVMSGRNAGSTSFENQEKNELTPE